MSGGGDPARGVVPGPDQDEREQAAHHYRTLLLLSILLASTGFLILTAPEGPVRRWPSAALLVIGALGMAFSLWRWLAITRREK